MADTLVLGYGNVDRMDDGLAWHVLAGLALMGAHAAFGFDGFLHYTRAPMAAHTAMMNFTIWTEAAAALLLSCVVLARFIARVARTA